MKNKLNYGITLVALFFALLSSLVRGESTVTQSGNLGQCQVQPQSTQPSIINCALTVSCQNGSVASCSYSDGTPCSSNTLSLIGYLCWPAYTGSVTINSPTCPTTATGGQGCIGQTFPLTRCTVGVTNCCAACADVDGDGDTECTCFVAGTKITLSDGRKISIEEVEPGDLVKSLDEKGNWAISKVENLLTHVAKDYLEVQTEDRLVRATGNHPFYTGRDLSNGADSEYKQLSEFKVGDYLIVNKDGKPHRSKILSIKKVEGNTPVYNLHNGSGPHTYLAEDFVVHNK